MAIRVSPCWTSLCCRGSRQLTANLRPVQLKLSTSETTLTRGQVFKVTVLAQTGSQAVDGLQASLNFNPRILKVRRLTSGPRLPQVLLKHFSNSAGSIDFSAGALSKPPSGSFTLFTIEFEALSASTGTGLNFQFRLPRETNATLAGVSVLGKTSNARFVILDPSSTAPGAFIKSAPARQSAAKTSLILSWTSAQDASLYEYCLDTRNDQACSHWVRTNANSVLLKNLKPGSTYYWQVRARNPLGLTYANQSPNAFWSFKVASRGADGLTVWVRAE